MKYTAGELRKMNGRRCKLKCKNRPEEEGEIYVDDGIVSFLSRSCEHSDHWIIHTISCSDDSYSKQYDSITFLDEQQHHNIYYDDNGEIIKEGDRVLVGDKILLNKKQVFLCKIPKVNLFITEKDENHTYYNSRTSCIKYKEPEKKLRNLMLTDKEYEEVLKNYK